MEHHQYNHDTNCCRHKVSFLSSSPNKNHNNSNNNDQFSGFGNHPRIPSFLSQSSENIFRSDIDNQQNSFVKTEGTSSRFNQYSLLMKAIHDQQDTVHDKTKNNERNCIGSSSSIRSFSEVEAMKAKIIAHPQYSALLQVYIDCLKIGAPPEAVERLVKSRQQFEARQRCLGSSRDSEPNDPELDHFMEAYYNMLVKYREELTRPIQEAMGFIRRIEAQLNTLCQTPITLCNSSGMGSSEDDQENSSGGETELGKIDPGDEDRDLKTHLLRKYSGYLSSLQQELSKKKKRGKLPREARQKLLTWWELHYKWPYPSEIEKAALAETTGLDQKQINNWFINQRKRHWRPSEEMQFAMMDGLHHQNAAAATALHMDGHYMAGGPYRLGP